MKAKINKVKITIIQMKCRSQKEVKGTRTTKKIFFKQNNSKLVADNFEFRLVVVRLKHIYT